MRATIRFRTAVTASVTCVASLRAARSRHDAAARRVVRRRQRRHRSTSRSRRRSAPRPRCICRRSQREQLAERTQHRRGRAARASAGRRDARGPHRRRSRCPRARNGHRRAHRRDAHRGHDIRAPRSRLPTRLRTSARRHRRGQRLGADRPCRCTRRPHSSTARWRCSPTSRCIPLSQAPTSSGSARFDSRRCSSNAIADRPSPTARSPPRSSVTSIRTAVRSRGTEGTRRVHLARDLTRFYSTLLSGRTTRRCSWSAT